MTHNKQTAIDELSRYLPTVGHWTSLAYELEQIMNEPDLENGRIHTYDVTAMISEFIWDNQLAGDDDWDTVVAAVNRSTDRRSIVTCWTIHEILPLGYDANLSHADVVHSTEETVTRFNDAAPIYEAIMFALYLEDVA